MATETGATETERNTEATPGESDVTTTVDKDGDAAEDEPAEPQAEPAPQPGPPPVEPQTQPGRAAAAAPAVTIAALLSDLPKLATRAFGTPLLVSRSHADIVLGLIGPRLKLEDLAGAAVKLLGALPTEPLNAMEDGEGGNAPAARKPYEMTADGIAIIDVRGVLAKEPTLIGALLGATSYFRIGEQLAHAAADADVKGVLLEVDSCGGEANGAFDLADAIFAARSQKPIFAVAADGAYSAAYLIASAADKVFISRTGGVGSIGVYALHVDRSGADAQAGLQYQFVYAGARKIDGNEHEPLSDRARLSMQARVDQTYGIFVDSVAKYRGLSADAVRATEAGTFFGDTALAAKLADAVGNTDQALTALRVEIGRRAPQPEPVGTGTQPPAALAEKSADKATGAATDNVVDLASARDQASAAMADTAVEIVELCKLAGDAGLAAGFITKRMSVDAVRKELQSIRANASASRPTSAHIMPDAGNNDPQAVAAGWDRAFAQARGVHRKES